MSSNYEDIKNVFSYENNKGIGKFLKFLIIDGIFAIVLSLMAFVYNEESGFAVTFFGILFIIISFLIAIAILFEQKQPSYKIYKILKMQKESLKNYLVNKYKFELKNDLMTKKIDNTIYTLEYNLGVIHSDLARKCLF